MKQKILPFAIASILSISATANSTYFTIINPEKGKENYVTTPTVGLGNLSVLETDQDNIVSIPLVFSNDLPTNASIDYQISHVTTLDSDLIIKSGTVNVKQYSGISSIPVTIKGDYSIENDKDFNITLSNPKFLVLSTTNNSKDYTLIDNDVTPTVSIQDKTIIEADIDVIGQVVVSLSNPSGIPFTVDYAMSLDTASASDVDLETGTLSFEIGEAQKTIPITIKGDNIDENDENVKITLSNPTIVTLDKSVANIIIQDDDTAPSVTLSDSHIFEGDTDTYVGVAVDLSHASEKDISFDYELFTGTADETDFVKETGTVVFPAGSTSEELLINVLGDYTMEDDETLTIELSNPVNTTLNNTTIEVTLSNDDSEYEFNTLPLYGKVEYLDGSTWKDVIANYGYERDIQFRYNPTESEVLAVSRDINVGSFDTDPSTPYYVDGNHSLSDWGTTTSNKATFTENGVTITTELLNGNFSFQESPGTHLGVGVGSTATSGHLMNGEEVIIKLEGDFLNDVRIAADGLGSCYDYANGCETKVEIEAFDLNNNSIDIQGGYRQPTSGEYGEAFVDNYYFTGSTAISKFIVRTIPTNNGGANTNLSSGSNTLLNLTVSRSAFEIIDYKFTDVDGTVSTETINLNINEGNANTNVDLNQYLLNQ